MTLHTVPAHPKQRSYVLSLHRDAPVHPDRFFGRIEHLATGERFDFTSTSSLIFWLLQHEVAMRDPNAPSGETA